jgi:hypothetical protein
MYIATQQQGRQTMWTKWTQSVKRSTHLKIKLVVHKSMYMHNYVCIYMHVRICVYAYYVSVCMYVL